MRAPRAGAGPTMRPGETGSATSAPRVAGPAARARRVALAVALALVGAPAWGCAPAGDDPDPGGPRTPTEAPATALPPAPLPERTTAEITGPDLGARVAILADDAMQGRAPSTPGGRRASAWIAAEMERIGLEPMSDAGWFQPVPLVEATLDASASSLALQIGDVRMEPGYPDDVVYWTKRLEPEVGFDASDVVFVGYGAVAPEYGWNDYEGLDVEGKTVVILVNDPGYATGDPALFTGNAMTYYGRWTYKFEEAGRRGAAAALIVHETEPASYGWGTVSSSWTGPQYDLDRGEGGDRRALLEGWITRGTAEALFELAGHDFEALKAAAARPGFAPVPLDGVTASATLQTSIARRESPNVGGMIRGSERPDDVVLYTAHWDHLGMDPDESAADRIYNGAVDNATGVAAILEIAEAMVARETPPARSVLFLAVTAEESGLLGSEYYALNPVVPLARTVAGINIDAILPTGPARDLVVVGYGASELEDVLGDVVGPMGKRLTPDPTPEAGYFYRSDHISLAKRGVPMLYADAGEDLVEGGAEAGTAFGDDYRATRYHAVGDEYDPSWNLEGMAELTRIMAEVGARIADSGTWPTWYEGNEFRSLRDAQRPGG